MKTEPLNVPVLIDLYQQYIREYNRSRLDGFSYNSIQIGSGIETMKQVAPLYEWKFVADFTREGDTRNYFKYETFVDGVRFITLLDEMLQEDTEIKAEEKVNA